MFIQKAITFNLSVKVKKKILGLSTGICWRDERAAVRFVIILLYILLGEMHKRGKEQER